MLRGNHPKWLFPCRWINYYLSVRCLYHPSLDAVHRAIKEYLAMLMMMDYDYIIFVYVYICSYGHWWFIMIQPYIDIHVNVPVWLHIVWVLSFAGSHLLTLLIPFNYIHNDYIYTIIMANHTYVFDHDLTIHIMHIYIIIHNELFLFWI